ncbi:MAG: hypothetical protein D4R97_08865 [Bacteroidetes bacterium]|nr:MAG: hypothetical protein D4R97_08865 [Bacteroidota bacterium]
MAGMTMAPAMAQTNIVYAGQTFPLSVIEVPGDTYTWELYNEVTGVNFAAVPGNCPAGEAFFTGGINTGTTVNVTWLKPGIYFFKVTAVREGCTNNLKVGKMTVLESLTTAILAVNPGEICTGETANLSVTFTGNEPWSFKLQIKDQNGTTVQEFTGISASNNPFMIPVGPTVTTEYTVIEVTDSLGVQKDPSTSVSLTVNLLPRSSRIYLKIY